MGILAFILALVSAILIALLLWERIKLLRRVAEMIEQCEKTERERSQTTQTLMSRDRDETERLARLEHDLRSSLSVIVGFSSVLVETLQKDLMNQSMLLLKSANAIHQSATKSLKIIEAVALGEYSPRRTEQITKEGNGSTNGNVESAHHD